MTAPGSRPVYSTEICREVILTFETVKEASKVFQFIWERTGRNRTTKDAAAKILQGGFRDITGRYLTDREWSGVWVSDRPLDNSEGASGEALLQITIAEDRQHLNGLK